MIKEMAVIEMDILNISICQYGLEVHYNQSDTQNHLYIQNENVDDQEEDNFDDHEEHASTISMIMGSMLAQF